MPTSGPADTLIYYVAGYTIFFLITAIYLFSLALRRRSLIQDLETLEDIDKQNSRPETPSTQPVIEPGEVARQSGESRV